MTSIAITLAGAASAHAAAVPPEGASCQAGQFCYWPEAQFPGEPRVLDVDQTRENVCIPLPHNAEARSFVNRMHREITLYEGAHCSTEGDFRTYPGDGTYVPDAPYVVRAAEVWNS
ncbi:MAG: peptidase inhibitor family I36 protein [Sciscionella sp.]